MIPLYRTILTSTPVGPLTLLASNRGVRRVRFGAPGGPEPQVLSAPADHPILAPARHVLERYFRGDTPDFSEIAVEFGGLTPFQRSVLVALRSIPHGELTTYGDLARTVGSYGANRAAGQAVGANPIPILIPCHRVVAADRRLGGFSGGLERKIVLLELEGHRVAGAAEFQSRLRGDDELMLPF